MKEEPKEKFTLFYSGIYSQWYKSDFFIGNITYNCCEQYMMAMKAVFFHNPISYDKIMKSSQPWEQKSLGREVKHFDVEKWNNVCRGIVFNANLAKFKQNQNLSDELKTTIGTTLVECSLKDKIWGIGMYSDDPRCNDRSQWLGTNWLGEAITQVRKEIFGE